MQRTYILDTNVLLHDPKSMFVFEEHHIIIPIQVVEELDKFKTLPDERGYNARKATRYLDSLDAKGKRGEREGSLKEGILLEGGGKLRVVWEGTSESDHSRSVDNQILLLAEKVQKDTSGEVILVSRDVNLRVKARSLGLAVEDYRHDSIARDPDAQYPGYQIHDNTPPKIIADLYADKAVSLSLEGVSPNECGVFRQGRTSVLARHTPKGWIRVDDRQNPWGVTPNNKEQAFALSLLLDPRIELVTLMGKAGTGKTLFALVAGLHQTADHGRYRKMLVSRPVIPMGKGIGFLPGTMEEKLHPWMQPVFDNLELLVPGNGSSKGTPTKSYQYLFDRGLLEMGALSYIRGRSIPNQFIIIDEAQNTTPHEIKTILTRVGEGTKIVLTGDPDQIDNPYVDARSNGLSYVVERFKESRRSAHITLTKGERSGLAEEAAEVL